MPERNINLLGVRMTRQELFDYGLHIFVFNFWLLALQDFQNFILAPRTIPRNSLPVGTPVIPVRDPITRKETGEVLNPRKTDFLTASFIEAVLPTAVRFYAVRRIIPNL